VDKPLRHLFAAADLVISRAGANSICEILALRKPNILIPLSAAASRGDQILNAKSFAAQGFSTLLQEEDLTAETLRRAIDDTYQNRQTFMDKMAESHLNNAIETIMGLIRDCVGC
ncbi:MAG: UDP-N-acetylglucosamine--N-acetylmuramyl-(pentapeptide) pyrophosphoryl-undecaprenol N-acetylglucosamine transferase, partial [Clostridium sp.]|nr:UDP-N-acetylglucosamine--N-acetylmuramyl-(pentapeptide) pyrophosphoryl-undecaprenol N-acetylglucosamine transferase [Clostridium sp.]